MKSWADLLSVSETLLGPGGCPWDQKQTLDSIKPYLLEEVHELLEAIDEKQADKIQEELGDLLYVLIFLAKVSEKEKLFTLEKTLEKTKEKLIRRHPHVFGGEKAESSEEVLKIWQQTKKKEGKTNPFSGIPVTLPALARAQKVAHLLKVKGEGAPFSSIAGEKELGDLLWQTVQEAEGQGLDAEAALRKKIFELLSNLSE